MNGEVLAQALYSALAERDALAARLARVEAVLGEHWDWKAGRSLHAAVAAALRPDAHTEQKGAGA